MTFRSFVRSHREWLVYGGPVIIFVTFVCKDVLRDDYKDLSDSVTLAKAVFLIRDDVQTLKSDQQLTQPEQIQNESAYGLQIALRIEGTGMALSQISELQKKLPKDPQETEEVKKLQEQQAEQGSLSRTLAADRLKHTFDSDMNWKTSASLSILELAKNNRLLSLRVNDLGSRVVERAIEEAEHDENYYNTFKYISFLLYVIGATIFLLGRRYGIKDV